MSTMNANIQKIPSNRRPTSYMQHWKLVATSMAFSRPCKTDVFDFEMWKKCVFDLAGTFAKDNERFSKAMFINECMGEVNVTG